MGSWGSSSWSKKDHTFQLLKHLQTFQHRALQSYYFWGPTMLPTTFDGLASDVPPCKGCRRGAGGAGSVGSVAPGEVAPCSSPKMLHKWFS